MYRCTTVLVSLSMFVSILSPSSSLTANNDPHALPTYTDEQQSIDPSPPSQEIYKDSSAPSHSINANRDGIIENKSKIDALSWDMSDSGMKRTAIAQILWGIMIPVCIAVLSISIQSSIDENA